MEKSVHKGHRNRMRQAVLEHGADGLNDHQILEILLYQCFRNGDTNPLAHKLINRFGSLKNVLDADYDELSSVEGMGEGSAFFIGFIKEVAKRYVKASCFEDEKTRKFRNTDMLREYFEGIFLGTDNEEIRALVIDPELRLVAETKISDGTIGKVQISARSIANFVIKNNCYRVVLAHNHPRGACMPSKADLIVTKELVELLSELEIDLIDHIIVGSNGSLSLRASNHSAGIWRAGKGKL